MALQIQPVAGERILFEEGIYDPRRPMVFGVSNQAVYITREQHFREESWRLERVAIPDVKNVSIRKERSLVAWTLGGLVFTGGLLMTIGFVWNIYNALPGTRVPLYPWPLVFMIIGIAMPIMGRGRGILAVQVGKKTYKWKAGMLDNNKDQVQTLQRRFVDACQSAGVSVSTENT